MIPHFGPVRGVDAHSGKKGAATGAPPITGSDHSINGACCCKAMTCPEPPRAYRTAPSSHYPFFLPPAQLQEREIHDRP